MPLHRIMAPRQGQAGTQGEFLGTEALRHAGSFRANQRSCEVDSQVICISSTRLALGGMTTRITTGSKAVDSISNHLIMFCYPQLGFIEGGTKPRILLVVLISYSRTLPVMACPIGVHQIKPIYFIDKYIYTSYRNPEVRIQSQVDLREVFTNHAKHAIKTSIIEKQASRLLVPPDELYRDSLDTKCECDFNFKHSFSPFIYAFASFH